ncbi:MAG: hypothetical protein NDI94_05675 [Candidatus Woesearchaeota archaeon]|nr:hypothetical protein [Candidatus Woesearchaeota archaeon]
MVQDMAPVVYLGELALGLDDLMNIQELPKEELSFFMGKQIAEYRKNRTTEDASTALGRLNLIIKKSRIVDAELKMMDKSKIPIAKRLLEHHFLSIVAPMKTGLDYYADPRCQEIPTAEQIKVYMSHFQQVKVYLTAAAYLATFDQRYINFLSHSDMLLSFDALNHVEFYHEEIDHAPDISNLVYLALLQPVQNAQKRASHIKFRTVEAGNFLRYDIIDDGTGILGKDGKPLNKEDYYKLFLGYTTTGGGLGLQALAYISELIGGSVEVVSKAQGREVIACSTTRGEVAVPRYFPRELEHGTMFSLYVPLP